MCSSDLFKFLAGSLVWRHTVDGKISQTISPCESSRCFSSGSDDLGWHKSSLDVSFTCLVHDWELESVADFLDVIYSVVPRQGETDTICWNSSSNQVFSVNYYYKMLISPAYRYFP